MAREDGGAAALLRDAAARLARVVAGAVDGVEALAATDPEKAARAAGVVARAGAAVLAFEARLAAALEADAEDTAERTEADVDDDEPRGDAPDAEAVREVAVQRGLRQLERLFGGGAESGAEGADGPATARPAGDLDVPGPARPAPA